MLISWICSHSASRLPPIRLNLNRKKSKRKRERLRRQQLSNLLKNRRKKKLRRIQCMLRRKLRSRKSLLQRLEKLWHRTTRRSWNRMTLERAMMEVEVTSRS